MQNQHSINVVFEQFVVAIRSMSVVKAVSPLLLLIVLWGSFLGRPTHNANSASNDLFSGAIRFLPTSLAMPSTAVDSSAQDIQKPRVVLQREQQYLVNYISRAYQVDEADIADYVVSAYAAARKLKVDPLLVLSIMSIESSFDPEAESNVGAQGLMQVLTRVHTEKFLPFGGAKAAFDVHANILVGTQIIHEYIKREGSVEGALKSYVGAALMADDGGYGWKVLAQRARLLAISQGKPIPSISDQRPEKEAVATVSHASTASMIDENSTLRRAGLQEGSGLASATTDASPLLLAPAATPIHAVSTTTTAHATHEKPVTE